ncbi:hypothetical protein TSUD_289910 [Trifolium subterraneum]|uniref:Uncharacterized protein n=1 Tax=Trifolium subterraneum TaxID=3900 RepID=A0A2Z6M1G3_TRISU|nr:hypothetical protein TSUD_289910 [Trifolium subterraneum]
MGEGFTSNLCKLSSPQSRNRKILEELHDAISFSRLSSYCKLILPVGLPSLSWFYLTIGTISIEKLLAYDALCMGVTVGAGLTFLPYNYLLVEGDGNVLSSIASGKACHTEGTLLLAAV